MEQDILKCYGILDVQSGATVAQVRKAYVELAHVWDPAKHMGNPILREKAAAKRAEIDAAYQALAAFLPDLNRGAPRPPAAPDRPADAIGDQPARAVGKTPAMLIAVVLCLTAGMVGIAGVSLWHGVHNVVRPAVVSVR